MHRLRNTLAQDGVLHFEMRVHTLGAGSLQARRFLDLDCHPSQGMWYFDKFSNAFQGLLRPIGRHGHSLWVSDSVLETSWIQKCYPEAENIVYTSRISLEGTPGLLSQQKSVASGICCIVKA